MNQESVMILKIRMESGPSRRMLLQALDSCGSSFHVVHSPAITQQSGDREDAPWEWITFGPPDAQFATKLQERFINKNAKIFRSKSVKKWQDRLNACGITTELSGRVSSNAGTYLRRFVVRVFHLKALQILPLGKAGILPPWSSEDESDTPSVLWRRLESTAVRTLYALDLDMGELVISAGEEGKFTVEEISVTPDMRGVGTADLFANAMAEMLMNLSQLPVGRELLIGMDPEFLLYDHSRSRVIPASRYLNRQGEAGCDSLRIQGQLLFPLAELRPAPAREPREIMIHLLHAFRIAGVAITDEGLFWQAGGMPQQGFPLGGHLHFSGIPLSAELLRSLDNYLALLVSVLEDKRSFRRRPRYGFLGDFRLQAYGGFEYRTLPSFLISPLVTKGVVALSRLIAENVETLTARPLQDDRIYFAFYAGQQDAIRNILNPLIEDITSVESYSRYENYIAPFLEAVLSGRTWDESTDIKRHWKI